jgi:hypothetical protein
MAMGIFTKKNVFFPLRCMRNVSALGNEEDRSSDFGWCVKLVRGWAITCEI